MFQVIPSTTVGGGVEYRVDADAVPQQIPGWQFRRLYVAVQVAPEADAIKFSLPIAELLEHRDAVEVGCLCTDLESTFGVLALAGKAAPAGVLGPMDGGADQMLAGGKGLYPDLAFALKPGERLDLVGTRPEAARLPLVGARLHRPDYVTRVPG